MGLVHPGLLAAAFDICCVALDVANRVISMQKRVDDEDQGGQSSWAHP
jgi:hypothetical protein